MSALPRSRRVAWLTLLLVAAAFLLLLTPDFAGALRFERAPIGAGEYWRLFSGHLVHDQGPLAAVDLTVLAVLGAWWELRSRALYAWILLASAALASIAVLALSSFSSYVGSSALSAGLFVAALLELLRCPSALQRWMAVAALALFVAKCTLESLGHDLLSVVALAPGTQVAASAHWAGGAAGAIVVLAKNLRSRRLVR